MAEQQEYKLTLSRWHKVAERARKLPGEFEVSCQQHISGWSASVLTEVLIVTSVKKAVL